MTWLVNVALALSMLQQIPRQRSPMPGRGAGGMKEATETDAVATFAGTFKAADKKFVSIEVDGGEMRMYLTHATKFIRDGKPAKASDFESGEPVTADTSRDVRMNLLAVKIELVKPVQSPAKE